MTTRDDALRLDTAIRNAVAFGGLPLTGRFEAAFAAVLGLHKPQAIDGDQPNSSQYCPSCIDDREDFADYPCPTIRALAKELRVSGEDRPEPTPAPREPRVWRHGVHTDIDGDVNDVVGKTTGRRWQRMPGKEFVWTSAGVAYSAGTVLYVEHEVAEVVPPEGTP